MENSILTYSKKETGFIEELIGIYCAGWVDEELEDILDEEFDLPLLDEENIEFRCGTPVKDPILKRIVQLASTSYTSKQMDDLLEELMDAHADWYFK